MKNAGRKEKGLRKSESTNATNRRKTKEERIQEREETEERRKRETEGIKELIPDQKQPQEQSAAELCLLRGELNKQVTRISEVQESMTLKIVEVEKSGSSVEDTMTLIYLQ